jgi:hypothetical protein
MKSKKECIMTWGLNVRGTEGLGGLGMKGCDLQCMEIKLKCGFLETKGGLIDLSRAHIAARASSGISSQLKKRPLEAFAFAMNNEDGKLETRGRGFPVLFGLG